MSLILYYFQIKLPLHHYIFRYNNSKRMIKKINSRFKIGHNFQPTFKHLDSLIRLETSRNKEQQQKDNQQIRIQLKRRYNKFTNQIDKKYKEQIYKVRETSDTLKQWYSPQKLADITIQRRIHQSNQKNQMSMSSLRKIPSYQYQGGSSGHNLKQSRSRRRHNQRRSNKNSQLVQSFSLGKKGANSTTESNIRQQRQRLEQSFDALQQQRKNELHEMRQIVEEQDRQLNQIKLKNYLKNNNFLQRTQHSMGNIQQRISFSSLPHSSAVHESYLKKNKRQQDFQKYLQFVQSQDKKEYYGKNDILNTLFKKENSIEYNQRLRHKAIKPIGILKLPKGLSKGGIKIQNSLMKFQEQKRKHQELNDIIMRQNKKREIRKKLKSQNQKLMKSKSISRSLYSQILEKKQTNMSKIVERSKTQSWQSLKDITKNEVQKKPVKHEMRSKISDLSYKILKKTDIQPCSSHKWAMQKFTKVLRKVNNMLINPLKNQQPKDKKDKNQHRVQWERNKQVEKVVEKILSKGDLMYSELLEADVFIVHQNNTLDITSAALQKMMHNKLDRPGQDIQVDKVPLTTSILEKIAQLIDKNYKILLKINQNEFNIIQKINMWIDQMGGHEGTKRIFLQSGNHKLNDKHKMTPSKIMWRMFEPEYYNVGPTNIKLNKLDKTCVVQLEKLIDIFINYNKQLKMKWLKLLSGQVLMDHENFILNANKLVNKFDSLKNKHLKNRLTDIRNFVAESDAFKNVSLIKVDALDQIREFEKSYFTISKIPNDTRQIQAVIDTAICSLQQEHKKFCKKFHGKKGQKSIQR